MPKPQKKFLGPSSTQKWPDGPQKAQNDPKIKKSENKKNLQIEIYQCVWINLKNIFRPYYNPKIAQ